MGIAVLWYGNGTRKAVYYGMGTDACGMGMGPEKVSIMVWEWDQTGGVVVCRCVRLHPCRPGRRRESLAVRRSAVSSSHCPSARE